MVFRYSSLDSLERQHLAPYPSLARGNSRSGNVNVGLTPTVDDSTRPYCLRQYRGMLHLPATSDSPELSDAEN